MNFDSARSAAKKILEQFKITEPPIDPAYIARELGLTVKFVRFSQDYCKKISGFYRPEELAIYVNSDEVPKRQTFTIAHELGHHILHREWAKTENYKILMRGDLNSDSPEELEANEFAGHLLCPRYMLDKYKDLEIKSLSELFAISVPAINFRLSKECL